MATTIVTKNSTTAASVPSAGSLTQGELAVNVTDKRLFTKDSGGTVVEVGTNPSALTVSGAFSANGGATLGDASGDALTINSSAVSIPNGLNFGSNNLVLSSGNVGIGTSSPSQALDVATALASIRVAPSTTTGNALTRYVNTGGTGFVGLDNSTGGLTTAYALNLYHTGAYPIVMSTNSTERMRIDSSGNVGIGTSNAAPANGKGMSINGGSITRIDLRTSTSGDASGDGTSLQLNGNDFTIENRESGFVAISTSLTERMRIDPSGTVSVGTTSASTGGVTCAQVLDARTRNAGFGLGIIGNASNTQVARFAYDSTAVGAINVGTSTTSYATSSDYRLKENIAPMTGALDTVSALKPCTYTWKADGSDGQGFIAHELQAVVPDCVTGEKDAVDAEGKPVYQGIDTSFLVATLTAAIQEQQAIITDLKARIENLESK